MFQGQTIGIPGQIFAFDDAVSHRDVFPVPEGVLCLKATVFKHGVFDLLERVFALICDIAEGQVLGSHHKVLTGRLGILHADFRVDQPNSGD